MKISLKLTDLPHPIAAHHHPQGLPLECSVMVSHVALSSLILTSKSLS